DALEQPKHERAAFLRQACPDDELRLEVESLLAEEEQARSFLETPAVKLVAKDLTMQQARTTECGEFTRATAAAPEQALNGIGESEPSGLIDEGAGNFHGTTRFEVQRRLGAGGFGIVYQVYDRELDAIVALKALRRMTPESVNRFKEEFRA